MCYNLFVSILSQGLTIAVLSKLEGQRSFYKKFQLIVVFLALVVLVCLFILPYGAHPEGLTPLTAFLKYHNSHWSFWLFPLTTFILLVGISGLLFSDKKSRIKRYIPILWFIGIISAFIFPFAMWKFIGKGDSNISAYDYVLVSFFLLCVTRLDGG